MLALAIWAFIGGVGGVVARAVFSGHDSMRIHLTVIVALLGAYAGGLVANDLFAERFLQHGVMAWVGGAVGACAMLGIASAVRRAHALSRAPTR